jgi:hypothetical protein
VRIYIILIYLADVEQALTKIRRQESGMDFQRLPLHEIVVFLVCGLMKKVSDCFHLVGNIFGS